MDSILGQILDQPAWLVYLIVGLVVFVEDALFVGFVVPGETVAVLGGVTASLGTTNVWLIGLIVVAAAVLGDSVGYEIGRVWGTQIIARPFFDKRRQRLDQARAFLRERGGYAVFLARWTAFLRAVMPALAGTSPVYHRPYASARTVFRGAPRNCEKNPSNCLSVTTRIPTALPGGGSLPKPRTRASESST